MIWRVTERRDNYMKNSNIPKAPITKASSAHGKKAVKKSPIKRTLTIVGTTLLSLFLIVVITGCIVATALTIYVVKFYNNDSQVDLSNIEMARTSILYDKNGAEIKRLHNAENRIWCGIEGIPQHVQDAFVYSEDERFYEHDGVDWKRTFGAFANMFLHFWDTQQGGSTITQQLIKNITGDKESEGIAGIERKITEIFRAMNMERYYTKTDILEAYLNNISLDGNNIKGVQAAANYYFNKDVSQLDVAEAACIAAITKSPYANNPLRNPEKNKARMETILAKMYEFNAISTEEYEAAKVETLALVQKDSGTTNEDGTVKTTATQNWFVDAVINDVIEDLMELKGTSKEVATDMLYQGGYKVYTTEDATIQAAIEAKYLDPKTFSAKVPADPPQSTFAVLDYQGNILAVVGAIGEKPGDRVRINATQSTRSPGSCIKPIASYGLALENDLITWSSLFEDSPLKQIKDEKTGNMRDWPTNYTKGYSRQQITVQKALERSLNTVAARIEERVTPRASFDFLTKKLGFTTLVEMKDGRTDVDMSPMTVGGMTKGVIPVELGASYAIFGNGGLYYEPTTYSKVTGPDGETILEHQYLGTQAISRETSYIMNKLMQQVIEGPNGTGTKAKLDKVTVIGKTGTSQDWCDTWFVGCTPNYIGVVWYGYDKGNKETPVNTYYSSAQVWKNVLGDVAQSAPPAEFPKCDTVEELPYDPATGYVFPKGTPGLPIGYYKKTNIPTAPAVPVGADPAATTVAPAVTTAP